MSASNFLIGRSTDWIFTQFTAIIASTPRRRTAIHPSHRFPNSAQFSDATCNFTAPSGEYFIRYRKRYRKQCLSILIKENISFILSRILFRMKEKYRREYTSVLLLTLKVNLNFGYFLNKCKFDYRRLDEGLYMKSHLLIT